MVQPGITSVEFLEPGLTIADVTGIAGAVVALPDMTLPETFQPDTALPQPQPDQPAAQPDPMPDAPHDGFHDSLPDAPHDGPLHEDTTEELADPLPSSEADPEIDRLMRALNQALPLDPPAGTANPQETQP